MPTHYWTRVLQRATAGAFWNEWDGSAEKGELAKKSSTKAERPPGQCDPTVRPAYTH